MMGERLAQEAVGLSYLSGHDDWMENLRNSADPETDAIGRQGLRLPF